MGEPVESDGAKTGGDEPGPTALRGLRKGTPLFDERKQEDEREQHRVTGHFQKPPLRETGSRGTCFGW